MADVAVNASNLYDLDSYIGFGGFVWATVWDGTVGGGGKVDTHLQAGAGADGVGEYGITRSWLSFDLTAYSEIISTATLRLYITSAAYTALQRLAVTKGIHLSAAGHPDFGDYGDQCPHDTVYAYKLMSDLNINQYNNFELDVTGLAWVQAAIGGTLKLCIREGINDVDNGAPMVGASGVVKFQRPADANPPQITFDYGNVYPTGIDSTSQVRVTNIIHRYVRAKKAYTMECSLGEVTSDFGLPEWLTKPTVAAPSDADMPATKGDVDYYVSRRIPEKPSDIIPKEYDPFGWEAPSAPPTPEPKYWPEEGAYTPPVDERSWQSKLRSMFVEKLLGTLPGSELLGGLFDKLFGGGK